MVSAEASLLSFLRRIRRRMRGWRALEGAAAGGAIGFAGAAAWIGLAHLSGSGVGWAGPAVLAFGCVTTGALLRALRRIPIERCARVADGALDGHDRVLSALHLARHEGPFPRALVADAIARLATLAPAVAFPGRRPKTLPLAAASALVLAVAIASPIRSRAARPIAAPVTALAGPRAVVVATDLDAERAAARAAAEAARRLDDTRLGALAADLERLLAGLQTGRLDAGEALDEMKAIEAAAARDARATALDERAHDAALEALSKQGATRAAAEALKSGDEAATQSAMSAAADARPTETGRALQSAARGISAATGASGDDKSSEPGRRRLAREQPNPSGNTATGDGGGEQERRLERLSRDLDDAAARCKAGDPTCQSEAEARAKDLSRLSRRAAGGEAMRRLERAAKQLRSRMGRGDLAEGSDDAAVRRFQRAARGGGDGDGSDPRGSESGTESNRVSGLAPGEGSEGQADAEGSMGRDGKTGAPGQTGEAGEPGAQQLGAAGTEQGSGSGEGVGKQAGGEVRGERTPLGARGRDAEARVADGAGPNRAQVIGSAGGRGFAADGYARVYSDYSAAVEDALGATAVPEGKRFLVRRYFDLIRPRPAPRGGGR
jgi:hypothetical protein